MRTKPFTFKKTKRVKVVTEHPALSVDLTVDDAESLFRALKYSTCHNKLSGELQHTLKAFIDSAPSV